MFTTTRMTGNFGFEIYVVSDATATFDRKGYDAQWYSAEDMHNISLASLHQEFTMDLNTDTLLKYAE